ncbi:MAG: riboflavin synthase [Lentisphaerae bacterium]|nr:riboflavin synthase [Lentisphaerota bacterium]
MFTGLIQRIGTLAARNSAAGGVSLAIGHAPWETPLAPGESVAVNGVCLTVAGAERGSFACDALPETLARSNLGALPVGGRVNLERALRLGDRLGGHMVAGHIDGAGRIGAVRAAGRDTVLRVVCDAALLEGIVRKGSVACDGVSLTVASRQADGFEVWLVPVTRRDTTLGAAREGDAVNIELDMIGKYVRQYLGRAAGADGGVSLADLARAGFA